MTIKTEMRCDGCGADCQHTSNSIDYRLELIPKRKTAHNGAVTDMMIYPDIDEPKHFCGLQCLATWLAVIKDAREVKPGTWRVKGSIRDKQ